MNYFVLEMGVILQHLIRNLLDPENMGLGANVSNNYLSYPFHRDSGALQTVIGQGFFCN